MCVCTKAIYVCPPACMCVHVNCLCVLLNDATWVQSVAMLPPAGRVVYCMRMCINWSLSACVPHWEGECVGVCMFGSGMYVCLRFHPGAPSVRVGLPGEFSALSFWLSVNQPVSPSLLRLSTLCILSIPSRSNSPSSLFCSLFFFFPLKMEGLTGEH